MTATYNFQSERTHALKKLRLSYANRVKKGWTMPESAGFIVDDIKDIGVNSDDSLRFTFHWETTISIPVNQLNLREQSEAIKWLEEKKIGLVNI